MKRYTTRTRTQTGVDLYALAKGLLRVSDPEQAAVWVAAYARWCSDCEAFLREETTNGEDGAFLAQYIDMLRDMLS